MATVVSRPLAGTSNQSEQLRSAGAAAAAVDAAAAVSSQELCLGPGVDCGCFISSRLGNSGSACWTRLGAAGEMLCGWVGGWVQQQMLSNSQDSSSRPCVDLEQRAMVLICLEGRE